MTIVPNSGIIDFGTFTTPEVGKDGIQGQVPAPLIGQETYILSASGWIAPTSGSGTVTSVDVSGGTTGVTFTGGPITSSGTITMGGTLAAANGGTGQTSYTNGQLLIGKTDGTLAKATLTAGTGISLTNGDGAITVTNSAPDQVVSLTAGTAISVSGSYPSFTVNNTAPDQTVVLTAGTGISTSGTYPNFTVTNTAPDQTVSLTGAGTTSISGSYPNFTITSNDQFDGTVTSVALAAGTGISVSGGPITSSGTITVTNNAPDQTVSLTGAGTTIISGTYPSFTITSNDAFTGTVTSVGGTGTVNGLTLTGTVTSSGSLTLGGTLSVDLSTATVTGTLPVTRGGTGQTSYTDGELLIGNTTGNTLTKATLTAGSGISITNGSGSITIAATGGGGGSGTVTSVDVSGGTTGLTFSGGPVTTSGTITMAGKLSVGNGGTGATTLTGVVIGNGTSAFTTVTAPTGAIVGTTDTQTLTDKRINPRAVVASGTSGTLTINGDTTDVYVAEGLTGAITLAQPSGTPVNGQRLMIRLKDDGTARAITWTTSAGAFRAVGITLPTTTVISKVTYVGCVYNSTDSFWDAVATVTQA
jgi:hypothetical protein